MRYLILKVATLYAINIHVDIVVACYVTHNFIRLHNREMSLLQDMLLQIPMNKT
jgi:hypothetical protein